ncbi:DBF4-type zinc finger-containing protein 2 [Lampris incognitus]|uniref:DBF4-type zinc finger-containing protein 2 n=1 Tax=Lampris incognitus TaxID=2546036 RepID=UPI0024B5548C|nr:DBF4-type zinc finger-containing protein 2 [Lampris incognitus]
MPAQDQEAFSQKDAERKTDTTSRVRVEEQAGPSRAQPVRQGYCGYCKLMYSSLDQHISSTRHRGSVRASARCLNTLSSVSSSQTSSLMERFLQDVLQHHPHSYNDTRPSHADLPSLSYPLVPREELTELCESNADSRSLGTREDLPSSDEASCQLLSKQEVDVAMTTDEPSWSGNRLGGEADQERLSSPVPEQDTGRTRMERVCIASSAAHARPPSSHTHVCPPDTHVNMPHTHSQIQDTQRHTPLSDTHKHTSSPDKHTHTPLPDMNKQIPPADTNTHTQLPGRHTHTPLLDTHTHTASQSPAPPPSVHRKAHRKTNRRNSSSSSSTSHQPNPHLQLTSTPKPGTQDMTWATWERERRDTRREEAFHSEKPDPMEETIEEVIQAHCYGRTCDPCQQGDTESFYFSLPDSLGSAESQDWVDAVQVALERGAIHTESHPTLMATPPLTRGLVKQVGEGWDATCLMEAQVDLEDQVYSHQLDTALHVGRREEEEGYRARPIEEILPSPLHIPPSFRGKTWAQIEREDEEKVESLVQQFRQGRFICYFDTESLARYGRRSHNRKGHDTKEEARSEPDVLPLLEHDEEVTPRVKTKPGKRRVFRLASRCQVVKVSHGTQTTPLFVPAVRQPAPERPALPLNGHPGNQEPGESSKEALTPEMRSKGGSLHLPTSYSHIITPLQPRTSVVYLLCSPDTPVASDHTPPPGPTPKRCRKRRRPLEHDLQGLKVKYKRLPVRFYDAANNCILKSPPKGFLPPSCSTAATKATVVRQLFRSLSPQLNAQTPGEEGTDRKRSRGSVASGSQQEESPGVKLQRSSDMPPPPFSGNSLSNGGHHLLGTLSPDSAQTSKQEVSGRRGKGVRGGVSKKTPSMKAGRPGKVRWGRREKKRARRGVPRRAVDSRRTPAPKSPVKTSPPATRTTQHTASSSYRPASITPTNSRSLRTRKLRGCPCCKS